MTYKESLLLTGDKWTTLSDEQKIEVLQNIENHSAYESGRLSCPVVGRFLYTGNDGVVLGSYDPNTKNIYINTSQFDSESKYGGSSEALVTTCLHEGRHAYQHQVVNGSVKCEDEAIAAIWKDNLSDGNYISYKENPRAYYNQPVEVDARKFAEVKYKELLEERDEYLEATNQSEDAKCVFEQQMNDSEFETEHQAASYESSDDYSILVSSDNKYSF